MSSLFITIPEFDTSTLHVESPPPKTFRHREYYFEDGNLVIQVENVLFRVFKSTFIRHSTVFNDLFSLPEPEGHVPEGLTDDNPLFFSGISSVDFERLLWVVYPPSYGLNKAHTLDEWTSILSLATRWDFPDIRALAINSIQSLNISPVDRIQLARDFDITGRWALSAYTALCERPEALTLSEASQLGLETSVRVAQIREQLRGTARNGGGYRSLTRSATAKREQPARVRQVQQWGISQSFFDQGPITPPVRPTCKRTAKTTSAAPRLSRTSQLVAEAFGLDVAH